MLFGAGGGDAVGLPARLAAVGSVAGVVLELGARGGRDPPAALAPLLQERAEVNPAAPGPWPRAPPHYPTT